MQHVQEIEFNGVSVQRPPADMVMRLALAPQFDGPLAQALSGYRTPAPWLAWLVQRRWCERVAGEDRVRYVWAQRVRRRLRARARAVMVPAYLCELEQAALQALEQAGLIEAALTGYLEQQDWTLATALVVRHAQRLGVPARAAATLALLERIPAAYRHADPALAELEGACALYVNARRAQRAFAACASAEPAQSDPETMLVRYAAYLSTSTLLLRMPPAPATLRAVLGPTLGHSSAAGPVSSPRARLAQGTVLLYAAWSEPVPSARLARALVELERLAPRERDPRARMQAAIAVLITLCAAGQFERARLFARAVESTLAQEGTQASVPALHAAGWSFARLLLALAAGCPQTAPDALPTDVPTDVPTELAQRLQALLQAPGLARLSGCVHLAQAGVALGAGDLALARARLDTYPGRARCTSVLRQALYEIAEAWLALRSGQTAEALAHSQAAQALLPVQDSVVRAVAALTHAHTLACNEPAGAVGSAGAVGVAGTVGGAGAIGAISAISAVGAWFSFHAGLVEAHAARARADATALRAALIRAWGAARREQIVAAPLFWTPEAFAELCLDALDADIEAPFVRALVRRLGLPAPGARSTANWPWAVKITTLGVFAIWLDGESVSFTGKVQRRPLELLKAIVAHGGKNVDVPALAAMLWPDATGGSAHSSFDITLHRLRRMLVCPDAVLIGDRRVTLNPQRVWVDTAEFSRLINGALDQLVACAAQAPGPELIRTAHWVLDLYGADFLHREEVAPWLITARDKLRSLWLRFVTGLGSLLCAHARHDEAIAFYQRALESDPLAEELYRQLMLCYQYAGRYAEAASVYRRCRDMLSIMLGITPAERTTGVFKQCLAQIEPRDGLR
ncbi:hypothetical protein LMG19083_04859 [Ralstonia psammae]|uniref:Bacterial transcriptional activator domain-containing protein n=1 Tax=Ralstonia psammae TaxID=3058598 RepID=A0ABN9JIH5_9RALS|nr:bacterial transcriptional activator domain-containing protein [Ralstonia sp. LMG 19083]CAJ0809147.1 hypothetical protein LMG19083_04859 [Ralstonia sp. LMG 19083]